MCSRSAQPGCHHPGRTSKEKRVTGTFTQRHMSLQVLSANLAKSLLEGARGSDQNYCQLRTPLQWFLCAFWMSDFSPSLNIFHVTLAEIVERRKELQYLKSFLCKGCSTSTPFLDLLQKVDLLRGFAKQNFVRCWYTPWSVLGAKRKQGDFPFEVFL